MYSHDVSKAKVYHLKLTGVLDIWGEAESDIEVTIYKACDEANISPYPIPSQTYVVRAPSIMF